MTEPIDWSRLMNRAPVTQDWYTPPPLPDFGDPNSPFYDPTHAEKVEWARQLAEIRDASDDFRNRGLTKLGVALAAGIAGGAAAGGFGGGAGGISGGAVAPAVTSSAAPAVAAGGAVAPAVAGGAAAGAPSAATIAGPGAGVTAGQPATAAAGGGGGSLSNVWQSLFSGLQGSGGGGMAMPDSRRFPAAPPQASLQQREGASYGVTPTLLGSRLTRRG